MKIKDSKIIVSALLVSLLLNLNLIYHRNDSNTNFKIYMNHLYHELNTSIALIEELNDDSQNFGNRFDLLNQSLNIINWMINKAPLYSDAVPEIQFYSLNSIMHAINLGTNYNKVYIPAFGKKDKLSKSEIVLLTEIQKLLIKIRDGLQVNDTKEFNETISSNQVHNLFRDIYQTYENDSKHIFFHYKLLDLYLLNLQE